MNEQINYEPEVLKKELQVQAVRNRYIKKLKHQQNQLINIGEERQILNDEGILSDHEIKGCIDKSVLCFMTGEIPNLVNSVNTNLSRFIIKRDYNCDWNEARNISQFIRASTLKERKLAKAYYDLAEKFYVQEGIGQSTGNNRNLLLSILPNEFAMSQRNYNYSAFTL